MNHRIYDSFGNLVGESNSSFDSRYSFTGREFDEETGLHYYRARYYDGELGQFISQYPIGFSGGTNNLYAYVGNEPISNTDSRGLMTDRELLAQLRKELEWCKQEFGTKRNGRGDFNPSSDQKLQAELEARRNLNNTGRSTYGRDDRHGANINTESEEYLSQHRERVRRYEDLNDFASG
ncbi:MAG: RHS repeat-associated core domain-containing protein, partial [Cyanobacteria bacterium P01_E01_bin.43]